MPKIGTYISSSRMRTYELLVLESSFFVFTVISSHLGLCGTIFLSVSVQKLHSI